MPRFRDRVELKPEEFYRRLARRGELPDDVAAHPGRRSSECFRDARPEADEVVAVLLAVAACRAPIAVGPGGDPGRRRAAGFIWWTAGPASLGVGMLALRGAELAESGWRGARDCGGARAGSIGQSGMLLTVDTVRQPASVGTGLTGQGLARGNAGCEADPLARCRGSSRSGGPGAGPGQSGAPGAGRCWRSA